MHQLPYLPVFGLLLFFTSCVSSKVYRAELSAREQCEAREKVLVQEVLDRRGETNRLIEQVGSLNRSLGNQDAELRDLKIELTNRTQQMGESSTKLLSEKTNLEKDLAGKTALLQQREATLESISTAQKSRQKILDDLKNTLLRNYPGNSDNTLEVRNDAVLLTLADEQLFDKNGIAVSVDGQKLLQPLAVFLTNRPEVDVQVLAYTDNQLPKGAKGLSDTWDWSLARAVNVVRLLIREFNVNANQLTPIAKGEFYPLTSNESSAGRQKNRRTVIAIYPSLPAVPKL
ncbi:MAG: OmpA family protein [Lewinellaceae bacterium]|nr:OmpA family protein [Saprospiraceae bacterium]MCB9316552.1 OmpA family protein [Lewinellaceae bacterium]MCB9330460.1 OmpA family protein [Lewinellaceae bacterium]